VKDGNKWNKKDQNDKGKGKGKGKVKVVPVLELSTTP
jgi:hypothetical protein